MQLPRLILSAPHRSSGKTTISIGICAVLSEQGLRVRPFKKGPDFIDPMWLTSATGANCFNLDFYMMGEEQVLRSFQKRARDADVSIIEGNMGLFDGIELDGKGSTAHLAQLLKAPVILIVDSSKMTHSIAPLISGFANFDSNVEIAGVILNKVASARHEEKLRSALKYHHGVEVIGSVPRIREIEIVERHLGLRTVREETSLNSLVNSIKDVVKEHVDTARLLEIARGSLALQEMEEPHINRSNPTIKLGVARDEAFNFYYPENFEALIDAGAELIYFSPISDKTLPSVDGLYIGGGFPEIFMDQLSANIHMREQIRDAIEFGMPVYAECGGLMYLSRSLSWHGQTLDMVGALPCDILMHDRPRGHGYISLKTTGKSWIDNSMGIIGHEFHYSEAVNMGSVDFAYDVYRGRGIDGSHDGIVYKNVLASYAHLHSVATPQWAQQFVLHVLASLPLRAT